ncbi:MAG: hypothetical protein LH467_03550 [Gemmatimonadaceae bacterium]|nr:hypothetical protein [Gemmatimonadaceae bacterium]
MIRRLVALLSSVTMLHLSVVSGESACASPAMTQHQTALASSAGERNAVVPMSAHAMPMTAADGATHMMHSVSAGAVGTAGSAGVPPCEIPTQQHCCGALVGCSVSVAITDATQVIGSTVSPTTRICVALHDAPASFAPAPEPPPPKA